MKISFIVCTRNRVASLLQTLDSVVRAIEAAPEAEAEIIVVDNGSEDGTDAALKRWSASVSIDRRDVLLLTQARPGVAGSRNAAIARASGDIIAFIDDDCVVSDQYLRDLIAHYAGDTESVIRGGRVELGSTQDIDFTTKTEALASRLTYPAHPGGFVHGCNMTCSRAVIERIGGFDAAFGPGATFRAAEDTDFIYRGWAAGVAVEYVPDMSVKHFHGRRDPRTIDRLHWNYQFGNGALYAKHIGRSPWLIKHLYWSARNAARELVGGPRFDAQLGLTWRAIVTANLSGVLAFAWHSARTLLTRAPARA